MIKETPEGYYLVDTQEELESIHNRQYGIDFSLVLTDDIIEHLKQGKALVNDGGEYTQEIWYKGGDFE